MSILESLGVGLRSAAGILSPDTRKLIFEEDRQKEMLQQQQKMMLLQHLQRQREIGAIPDEAVPAIAQQFNVPPAILGGMSAQVQQHQAALAKEAAYRQAIAQLGPNPTDEQLAQVAGQFSGPDKTLDVLQKARDRQSQIEQRRAEFAEKQEQFRQILEQREQARQDRIAEAIARRESTEQIAQMRIDAQREMQNDRLEFRRSMGALAGAMRQPPQPHFMTNDKGEVIAIDRSLNVTPVIGPDGKPVTTKASTQIEQKESLADYANTLVSRLETSLKNNPRSTTGMASGVVRGFESVANTVSPGIVDSQATIAQQTKEQLLNVLGQIRGVGVGRLSNQDMRRLDTTIGAIRSGTPDGMKQGLQDAKELIKTLRGAPAPVTSGSSGQLSDQALLDKYLPKK